ncbi:MAG: hypothetical protein GTO18_15140, partial [Anaerolineales bacterium]|nr:hypothetical protein [Anaerolineales bacterium]
MTEKPKQWNTRSRILVIVGAILLLVVAAVLIVQVLIPDAPDGETHPPLVDTSATPQGSETTMDNGEPHLTIQLSEGQAQPQMVEPVPTAIGEPLSDQEIQRILDRLPALLVEPEDQVDFRLPEEPLPPPRTGETIDEVFPPPEQIEPVQVDTGPLQVLRYAPEGEIPLAPFISVTFNQPMVPLTTIEDLSLEDVPIILEPDLPGIWRWIGTKTLTFQYDSTEIDRLPKATEYRVTVPAGTKSATGGTLDESVSWSFSTPPPKLINHYPSYGPQPRDPIIFIAFDQRIDPEAVLSTIEMTADGRPVSIMLASEEEIEADKRVSRMVG